MAEDKGRGKGKGKVKGRSGAPERRLKIAGDWEKAVAKALQKPPAPKPKPKS